MKINKIAISVVLAGLLLVSAGAARASTDINIYGCSAQFFLWSSMNSGNPFGSPATPNFLADSTGNGGAGCTNVTWAYDSAGTNFFYAHGTGCSTGIGDGSGTINISVAYKTSNGAIWSIMGAHDPEDTSACAPDGSGKYYQRKMANGTASGSCSSGYCSGGSCTVNANNLCTSGTSTCTTVTLGASDEAAAYFTQASWGNQYGLCLKSGSSCSTTNPVICRQFGSSGTCVDQSTTKEPMPDDYGLAFYNPMADPTAFFVNKAVTQKTCSSGAAANAGDMCASDSDCGNTSGACTSAVISNISRMMAAQIFTGQVSYWSDFGQGFPASLPIYACMRHAGAGTNITFDYAVLGHDHNWLPSGNTNMTNTDSGQSGNDPTGNLGPYTYFYDTIGSQLNCVNGIIDNSSTSAGYSNIGAIGYTDADRSVASVSGSMGTHTTMVSYNGVQPSRRNIRNGLYDFWSKNYLYYSPTGANAPSSGSNYTVFNALATYADSAARFTALSSGKGNFWAAIDEMHFMKTHANYLPGHVASPAHPQNP